jgi:hypothetical protein
MGGGGGLEPRTAIEGSFSACGGLGKLDRGLGRGETFFPDSDSDRDSDETFQISRKLGLVHAEFICLLDSQPWLHLHIPFIRVKKELHFLFTQKIKVCAAMCLSYICYAEPWYSAVFCYTNLTMSIENSKTANSM